MPSRRRTARDAARRDQALALYVAGRTYAQIAEEVGYCDKSSAHHAVTGALKQRATERADLADTALTDVLERLDGLYAAHWGPATGNPVGGGSGDVRGPDARSAEVILKVLDRKIRLLGLDAPTRVEVTAGGHDPAAADVAALAARISAAAAAAGVDLGAVTAPTPTAEGER